MCKLGVISQDRLKIVKLLLSANKKSSMLDRLAQQRMILNDLEGRFTHRALSEVAELFVYSAHRFLPERDYVTFGSLLSQFHLSSVVCLSVCNVGAPQWRSNRVCRVCKAHGPTATRGPTDATLLYFYPNLTKSRSGLCYRNSVCRLSVCNVRAP